MINDAIPTKAIPYNYTSCSWPMKKRFRNALEACNALIKTKKRAIAAGEEKYPVAFYECYEDNGRPSCGGWHFTSSDDSRPRVQSVALEAKKRHLQ